MATLPFGRQTAPTPLGHRLSQLHEVRGKAVGNVPQLQWVIFHQLQMAPRGKKKSEGERFTGTSKLNSTS